MHINVDCFSLAVEYRQYLQQNNSWHMHNCLDTQRALGISWGDTDFFLIRGRRKNEPQITDSDVEQVSNLFFSSKQLNFNQDYSKPL